MCARHLLAAALLFSCCVSSTPSQQPFTLQGTLVTPSQVLPNGTISITGSQIQEIATSASGAQGSAIITDSFIFPGLIDVHDHITWNILPRWRPNRTFNNRYEWQQTDAYSVALSQPHYAITADHELACDADRFGEIKAIVGGATSVVGGLTPSYGTNDNACILGLVRNLDIDAEFSGSVLNKERVWYTIYPLEMSLSTEAEVSAGLKSGAVTAFLIHAGEGSATDPAAAREFRMLDKGGDGFLRPGVSIIHGAAFNADDFVEMARAGVGLVWSPRSNIELYGSTTDVRSAKSAGVKMALAPDWSPTGSDGMLEELKYAATWNAAQYPPVFSESELASMATVVPAQLAAADKQIGTLAKGMYADLLLIRGQGTDPYQALVQAAPRDVRLVVIGGVPVYGDPDLMEKLLPGRHLERLTICGAPKLLHMEPQPGVPETAKSFRQVSDELEAKLQQWGTSLAELAPCNGSDVR